MDLIRGGKPANKDKATMTGVVTLGAIPLDYSKLAFTSVAMYSSIMPQDAVGFYENIRTAANLVGGPVETVIDGTACIGLEGAILAHGLRAIKLISIERNLENHSALTQNADYYQRIGLCPKVLPKIGNSQSLIRNMIESGITTPTPGFVNVVYYDPPWGGPDVWKGKVPPPLNLEERATLRDAVVLGLRAAKCVILKTPPNLTEQLLKEQMGEEMVIQNLGGIWRGRRQIIGMYLIISKI